MSRHLFRGRSGPALASLGVIAGLLSLSSACASPRVVTGITGSNDNLKLVYSTRMGQTGIVECRRQDDGSLSDCHDVDIDFKKKGE